MSGVDVVTDIIDILIAGITELGTGIAQGVSSFVDSLAFKTVGEGSSATTELNTYFVLVIVFAGIALSVALTRRVFGWLSSLGGSK